MSSPVSSPFPSDSGIKKDVSSYEPIEEAIPGLPNDVTQLIFSYLGDQEINSVSKAFNSNRIQQLTAKTHKNELDDIDAAINEVKKLSPSETNKNVIDNLNKLKEEIKKSRPLSVNSLKQEGKIFLYNIIKTLSEVQEDEINTINFGSLDKAITRERVVAIKVCQELSSAKPSDANYDTLSAGAVEAVRNLVTSRDAEFAIRYCYPLLTNVKADDWSRLLDPFIREEMNDTPESLEQAYNLAKSLEGEFSVIFKTHLLENLSYRLSRNDDNQQRLNKDDWYPRIIELATELAPQVPTEIIRKNLVFIPRDLSSEQALKILDVIDKIPIDGTPKQKKAIAEINEKLSYFICKDHPSMSLKMMEPIIRALPSNEIMSKLLPLLESALENNDYQSLDRILEKFKGDKEPQFNEILRALLNNEKLEHAIKLNNYLLKDDEKSLENLMQILDKHVVEQKQYNADAILGGTYAELFIHILNNPSQKVSKEWAQPYSLMLVGFLKQIRELNDEQLQRLKGFILSIPREVTFKDTEKLPLKKIVIDQAAKELREDNPPSLEWADRLEALLYE